MILPPRQGFLLPDFTRRAWASEEARARWAPRIARVAEAWSEIEWRSVAAGLRPAALTTLSQEALLAAPRRWLEAGLSFLPLAYTAIPAGGYATTIEPARPGEAAEVRIVIGGREAALEVKEAYSRGDDEVVGRLLGYPDCCRGFFRDVWQQARCVDTTWAMAVNGRGPEGRSVDVPANASPYANVLLRWIGVRAVPHLPCRFDCDGTLRLGERLVAFGRTIGLDAEMDWLVEMLSWPAAWSALHGIAEIKTPILRIIARTDATAERYDVRLHGSRQPEEGAYGLGFPYRTRAQVPLTRSRAFLRGLARPILPRDAAAALPGPPAAIPRAGEDPAWQFTDNGFPSLRTMDELHGPIVEQAVERLASASAGARAILDLGCGNGLLLKRICAGAPGCVPYGIDVAQDVIRRAAELQPEHRDHFAARDFFLEAPWPGEEDGYALVLLMVGRLLEVDAARARALVARVLERSEQVLLYVYPGYSSEPFSTLLERAGVAHARVAEGEGAPGGAGPARTRVAWLTRPSPTGAARDRSAPPTAPRSPPAP